MLDLDYLKKQAAALGVALSAGQLAQLDRYAAFLVDSNDRVNLTAITDPVGIADRHFCDSLAPLPLLGLAEGASLADVGTGAGFPGVVMAIARPDLRLCLIDSRGKRTAFLAELLQRLGVRAEIVTARAEDAGRDRALRERFDLVTARAVAALPALCEYCLPLVRVGGRFAALKGPDVSGELQSAERAMALCGGSLEDAPQYALAGGDRRTLVIAQKSAATPDRYPRPAAQIAKKPL